MFPNDYQARRFHEDRTAQLMEEARIDRLLHEGETRQSAPNLWQQIIHRVGDTMILVGETMHRVARVYHEQPRRVM